MSISAAMPSYAAEDVGCDETAFLPIEDIGVAEYLSDNMPMAASAEQISVEEININSTDDLKKFRDRVNGSGDDAVIAQSATVNLNCDIDLGGEEWEPIGKSTDPNNMYANCFKGTFNGNGHTVSNFKITDADTRSVGFFSAVTSTRKSASEDYANDIAVHDLKLDGVRVDIENTSVTQCAAALCGLALLPAAFENVSITNTSVTVNKESVITDDTASANAILSAGLAIAFGSVNASGISVQGSIDVTCNANTYAGGIVALDDDYATVGAHSYKNCTAEVDIKGASRGNLMLGGIAGYLRKDIDVINCDYISGSINGTGALNDKNSSWTYLSGIAGYAHSRFEGCDVGKVDISATGTSTIGVAGVTAMAYNDVIGCTSKATYSIKGDANTIRTFAAGTVCMVAPDSSMEKPLEHSEGKIENCSWTGGTITIDSYGPAFVGGLAGRIVGGYTLKNCYAEFDEINISINGHGKDMASGATQNAMLYCGGAVGLCYSSSITETVAKGTLNSTNKLYTNYTGGIVGNLNSTSYYYTSGDEILSRAPGGEMSLSYSDIALTVTGKSVYTGGIAGYLSSPGKIQSGQSSIMSCASFGDVTVSAKSTSLVGGGVGYTVDSYISDCASLGSLTISPTAATVFGGGFVGRLKEANTAWEDTDNPLSKTYNCYAGGKVYVAPNSAKVSSGPFTQDVVSNLGQKPKVEVTPTYANCFYIADTAAENAVGGAITNAADKTAYEGFDFDNRWAMSGGRAVPQSTVPSVCNMNYTEENGEAIRINSVLLSLPSAVKKIAVITTNNLTAQTTVSTYDAGSMDESEKYFKQIDINYDIPVFCTAEAIAITDGVKAVRSSMYGTSAQALVTNGNNTAATLKIYAAKYGGNGALESLTETPLTIEPMSALPINTAVPEGSRVFVWYGVRPLCPALR